MDEKTAFEKTCSPVARFRQIHCELDFQIVYIFENLSVHGFVFFLGKTYGKISNPLTKIAKFVSSSSLCSVTNSSYDPGQVEILGQHR